MNIELDPAKRAFFKDVLCNALKTVIPPGGKAQMIRNVAGLDGHALAGAGHEVYALFLLNCLVGVPNEIPGDTQEHLVLKALVDCKNKRRATVEGFILSLGQFCEDYLNEPKKTFTCMFFLQLTSVPGWIYERTILGLRVRPASKTGWKAVKNQLELICVQSEIEVQDLDRIQAVEISVKAKRSEEAIRAADEVSNLLRASFHAAPTGYPLMGRPSGPSNEFKPSPLYLVRSEGKHICWAFVPHVEVLPISLPDALPPVMGLYLDRLRQSPRQGTPRQILAQAMSLFTVAGDSLLVQYEFLALWQTLEILALETKHGNTSEVAARIGNFFRDGNTTLRCQLNALAPFRNDFVHGGLYDNERTSASFALGSC